MKLVICCDYGLDDAMATYDVLAHALQDGYNEVDIVAIGGNVPSEISLVNAKKLISNCDFDLPHLTIIDTTDLNQPCEYLDKIHGKDGMGDLFLEKELKNVGIVSFDRWTNSLGTYSLLSLGPMTLIPKILEHGVCDRIVFMGGNIDEEPNFEGYEFNHAKNKEAFKEVVNNYHCIAVTMDTCRNPLFNIQNKQIIGDTMGHKIIRRCRELTFSSGEKGCYVWDDIAVKALRHPDWFSLYTARDRDGNLLTVAEYILGKEYLDILDK